MRKYFNFVNYFRAIFIFSIVLTVFYLRIGDPYSAIMTIICSIACARVLLDKKSNTEL